MTIHLAENGTIELKGSCPVEDSDLLLQQLLANPRAEVDWSGCEAAHAAVVQVLLIAGAVPAGTPPGPFLREQVAPVLDRRT